MVKESDDADDDFVGSAVAQWWRHGSSMVRSGGMVGDVVALDDKACLHGRWQCVATMPIGEVTTTSLDEGTTR